MVVGGFVVVFAGAVTLGVEAAVVLAASVAFAVVVFAGGVVVFV